MTALLAATVLVPGVLALLLLPWVRDVRAVLRLAPWAPLPGLLLSLLAGAEATLAAPWLLTGSLLGLDATGRIFLFFTAALWLLAGVHARAYLRTDPRRRRFFAFHLLALTGNLGLVIALDVVSFYLFFALMSFAGYGLVVHQGDDEARRAGRVYLAMTVAGEAMLIAGLLLAVGAADATLLTEVAASVGAAPNRDLIVALLLAGFGIKAGAIPLHVWLPLAHPVAPTPASAVLSGAMIKAGLLGWLRVLPLGLAALPGWGSFVVAMGLVAAFFGVLAGVTQRDPKTTLAYSSISQMGMVNVAVGLALIDPDAAGVAIAACLAYATHHGLAKGALFLGTGLARASGPQRYHVMVRAGLVFAALAVAGAPLTSGGIAKGYLKEALGRGGPDWPFALDWALSLAAVGTTLLMLRFLSLVWHAGDTERSDEAPHTPAAALWLPWAVLLGLVGVVLWTLPFGHVGELAPPAVHGAAKTWSALWPIVAGGALAWGAHRFGRRHGIDPGRFGVPAGDLLVLVEPRIQRVGRSLAHEPAGFPKAPLVRLSSRWYGIYAGSAPSDRALRLEIDLTRWRRAATFILLITLVLVLLLAFGTRSP